MAALARIAAWREAALRRRDAPRRFRASTRSRALSPRRRPRACRSKRRRDCIIRCVIVDASHGFHDARISQYACRRGACAARRCATLRRIVGEEDPSAFAFDERIALPGASTVASASRNSRRRARDGVRCVRQLQLRRARRRSDGARALPAARMTAPRRHDRRASWNRGFRSRPTATFRFKTCRSASLLDDGAERRESASRSASRSSICRAVARARVLRRVLRAPSCSKRRVAQSVARRRTRASGTRCARGSRQLLRVDGDPRLRDAGAEQFLVAARRGRDARADGDRRLRRLLLVDRARDESRAASFGPMPRRCCRTGAGCRSVITGARARS